MAEAKAREERFEYKAVRPSLLVDDLCTPCLSLHIWSGVKLVCEDGEMVVE